MELKYTELRLHNTQKKISYKISLDKECFAEYYGCGRCKMSESIIYHISGIVEDNERFTSFDKNSISSIILHQCKCMDKTDPLCCEITIRNNDENRQTHWLFLNYILDENEETKHHALFVQQFIKLKPLVK